MCKRSDEKKKYYGRVACPDAELVQFLCTIVEKVVTCECLVLEHSRSKTILSFVRKKKKETFESRGVPGTPKATNRDSPCIRIDSQISAFKGNRQVIRKIESKERRVALWERESLEAGTSG